MPLPKLLLVPDADGYSEAEGEEVIRTELDGGVGYYRRDKIGASKKINVRWTMNPVQYRYWRAFFVTTTERGTLPFLCDLVSEDGTGPTEHECSFIPGSVSMPGQHGFTYTQQATLEAKPLAHDAALDAGVILIFENWGVNGNKALLSLEKLVNVTMPGYIG